MSTSSRSIIQAPSPLDQSPEESGLWCLILRGYKSSIDSDITSALESSIQTHLGTYRASLVTSTPVPEYLAQISKLNTVNSQLSSQIPELRSECAKLFRDIQVLTSHNSLQLQ